MTRFCLIGLLAGSFLWPSCPVSAQLRITEFMASNSRTLADEDGSFEDWIEVQNNSPTNASLEGWFLTDNTGDLAKWMFPATNLNGGACLVVFASKKDRRVPGRPLHTNFKLGAAGGYLALVRPDGATIATQFAPGYPTQVPDVSYGFALQSATVTLVATGAALRVLVPTVANGGSALAYSWTGAAAQEPFNDSAWRGGVSGVGFSVGAGLVAAASTVVRFSFDAAPVGDVVVDSNPSGTIHNGVNSGAAWVVSDTDAAPVPVTRPGVMQFAAGDADQVRLAANTDFNSTKGTILFWMRSAGTTGPGNSAAILFDRRSGPGDVIVQSDNGTLGRPSHRRAGPGAEQLQHGGLGERQSLASGRLRL